MYRWQMYARNSWLTALRWEDFRAQHRFGFIILESAHSDGTAFAIDYIYVTFVKRFLKNEIL